MTTPTDPAALGAGEMNAEIAKVLGWKLRPDGMWEEGVTVWRNHLPWATDIATAWDLVESLPPSVYINLRRFNGNYLAQIDYDSARMDLPTREYESGWQRTAPLAICRAFLAVRRGA